MSFLSLTGNTLKRIRTEFHHERDEHQTLKEKFDNCELVIHSIFKMVKSETNDTMDYNCEKPDENEIKIIYDFVKETIKLKAALERVSHFVFIVALLLLIY